MTKSGFQFLVCSFVAFPASLIRISVSIFCDLSVNWSSLVASVLCSLWGHLWVSLEGVDGPQSCSPDPSQPPSSSCDFFLTVALVGVWDLQGTNTADPETWWSL